MLVVLILVFLFFLLCFFFEKSFLIILSLFTLSFFNFLFSFFINSSYIFSGLNSKTLGVNISDFIQATINSSAYIPLYFTNPNNAKGAAPKIHNHDNVSIPRKFLKIKYKNIAIPTAKDEKMNCLIDSPKNIDSLKSRISLLIFISIYLTPPFLSIFFSLLNLSFNIFFAFAFVFFFFFFVFYHRFYNISFFIFFYPFFYILFFGSCA